MAKIDLEVAHTLTPEDALARIQALGEYYVHRHHAEVTWRGTAVVIVARYVGVRLEVQAKVGPQSVHAETRDLGFLLRKVGAEYLRKKLLRYLGPLQAHQLRAMIRHWPERRSAHTTRPASAPIVESAPIIASSELRRTSRPSEVTPRS
jgi:hypothetical protein